MTDPERALVARLVVDQEQLPDIAATLPSEAFSDTDLRDVYAAMVKLSNEGQPIDVVTLQEEIGRPISVPVLALTPGHSAPLDAYVATIKRNAFRRDYVQRLRELASRAEKDDPATLVAALQDSAFTLGLGLEQKDTLGRINLEDHRSPPPDPWLGILSPNGTTIFYGDGGDGKGWIAARMVSQLHRRVAILDFEMQPQEWGYRLSRFGLSLDDVLYYSPPTTFDRWANETAARTLRDEGVEFLVVDSAMYASNVEDPYSPNGALAYGRARRRLDNLPALLLAHTTGNVDKVFGSVYWRNECRIAWRVGKDTLTRQRHLICKKANGYSYLEGKRLEIEFNEEQGILNWHPHGQPWTSAVEELVPAGEF